jgi:AcrR family transcriptional regulator
MSGEQPKSEKRARLRGEERRALILRSAKRIFAHSPYAEASTGELARESEITEPMLYKHFGSKKGLFLTVLGEFGEQFFSALQERVLRRAEQDILDALEHVIDDYRATMKADPDIQRVLFQAVTESGDADVAHCVSKHNRRVYLLIRQLVERGQQEGYLDPTIDVDAGTWGYMCMILALQYDLMVNLALDIEQIQAETSRVWLRSLRDHER